MKYLLILNGTCETDVFISYSNIAIDGAGGALEVSCKLGEVLYTGPLVIY